MPVNYGSRLRHWLLALLALAGISLYAHDAGLSVAELRLKDATVELTVSFAPADVQRMLPPSARLENGSPQLEQLASLLWDVRAAGRQQPPDDVQVTHTAGDNLAFRFLFARPAAVEMSFRALHLAGLPATHRETFTVIDEQGRLLLGQTLSAAADTARVPLAAATPANADRSVGQDFAEFFKLGVEHIWTGYDHLAFLLGLLLVCRGFRSILVVITSFTLAHSLTLGLAATGVLHVPSRWVEPIIAASIVFVGVENLWRRGAEPRGRVWLTFAFGLVHGFGFASALTDLGVGSDGRGVIRPLLAFNLGVEFGQIVLAAICLPLLLRFFREEKVRTRGVAIGSTLIAVAGLYWLIERTVAA